MVKDGMTLVAIPESLQGNSADDGRRDVSAKSIAALLITRSKTSGQEA